MAGAPRRVADLPALQAALRGPLADRPVVTLDVFDTLVSRRLLPPERLLQTLAREVAGWLDRADWQAVLRARQQSEAGLRAAAGAQAGCDPECHLDALQAAWAQALLPQGSPAAQAELAARLDTAEMALERAALFALPGAEALLAALAADGRRIFLLSDMYLGARRIASLLEGLGLMPHVAGLYVSADCRQSKRSGRLFRTLMAQEGLSAAQLVHAGDHPVADARAPRRLGIAAVQLVDRAAAERVVRARTEQMLAARRPYWRGRQLLGVADAGLTAAPAAGADFYRRYGEQLLGPIYCTYVLGLIERLQQLECDQVCFMARDGWLFQQLFARLAPPALAALPQRYLHLSRRVALTAQAAGGLDWALARLPLVNPRQRHLAGILAGFGLPAPAFAPLAARHGLTLEAPLALSPQAEVPGDPRLVAWLADPEVQAEVRRHTAPMQARLAAYLDEAGFFAGGHAALVDIGWNGKIQHALARSFTDRDDLPRLTGLYFGFRGGLGFTPGPGSQAEGLMLDRPRRRVREQAVLFFEELFEESSRAAHATTVDYAPAADGRMQPVLRQETHPARLAERAANPHIAALQAGVFSFAERFEPARRLTGYRFAELKPYMLSLIERAVVYPTPAEAAAFAALAHADDFGADGLQTDAAPAAGGLRSRLARVRAAPWRYGEAAASPALPRYPLRLAQMWRS